MIKKIEITDIPGRATRYNELVTNDIATFIDSQWDAAEVTTAKYKNASSAFNAFRAAIKKSFAPCDVDVIRRGEKVYLVRKADV